MTQQNGTALKSIRGVRFEVLGPVDRRLSAPVSTHGRIGCPVCATSSGSYGRNAGPFHVNRYLFDHLARDHYRCLGCGWVGIVPGQHVTRSPHHEGPVPTNRKRPKTVRLAGLSKRMGERIAA